MIRQRPQIPPSLVPSLTSLFPVGGRWYQLEPGDTPQSIAEEVLEAAAPRATNPATLARYVAILRAGRRWNVRLYGEALERAAEPVNGDAYAHASAGRWPPESGGSFGLVWCPEITAWEAATGLPLIADADPPATVIDFLRVPT